MLKNYLKVAFRNIFKHKGYSFINIAGLAVGMAVCILIMLWVFDEISYDKFHINANDIYRVCIRYKIAGQYNNHWRTPPPLAEALKRDYPEFADVGRYTTNQGALTVANEEKCFRQNIGFADPSLFEMLTLPFVQGNPETAFDNPYSVVISETLANKYFANENPIGKLLRIENQFDLTVTGVIENVPHNSLFNVSLFTQFNTMAEFIGKETLDDWQDYGFNTFVLLNKGIHPNEMSSKIVDFLQTQNPEETTKLYLQPLTDIHLHSVTGGGPITYVYIFSTIAVFILLIACINFMNLSTARSAKRAKEIGLRKVVGANKRNIRVQFFGESIILAIIALVIGIFITELLLPVFNQLSNKHLTINFLNNNTILAICGLAIVTGIIAGSYPAIYLSSFEPIRVLKNVVRSGSSLSRKILVVAQFTLSIVLVIATLLISNQLEFIRNKKLGFDKENIVYLLLNNSLIQNYQPFKNELLSSPQISHVTATSSKVGTGPKWSTMLYDWEGNDAKRDISLGLIYVDYDFAETFDINMASGRFYSEDFGSEDYSVVLNEAAVKAMDMENPIGKKIWRDATIIGVTEDFNFNSLRVQIEPLCLTMEPEYNSYIAIKIGGEDITGTLKYIENSAKKYAPEFPFEYSFLDDDFDRLYKSEQRMGKMFTYFAVLALFISCLGLFGLTSYAAEQRTKEIGIRKVLGASISGIVGLLTKEFVILVLIANVIAYPIAYYTMSKWLQNFAFRIDISWISFILAAILALMITVITVCIQAIKAAVANPVESLRYE